MATNFLKSVLLMMVTLVLLSFDLPTGWFNAGSKPKSYEMGIDKGVGRDGTNAATIKSIDAKIEGFGTLMQQCKPDQYLGKRVRMTGYVKSDKVEGWAGLWLRVDQSGSQQSLSFDNMQSRSIKGTTDWKKYEIVLDVKANASMIAFGALLTGTGQIWFDAVSFEIVNETVPTTDITKNISSWTQNNPTNLDFEQ